MGEMCGPIGERHGRDVCSNRSEAWERCVLHVKAWDLERY